MQNPFDRFTKEAKTALKIAEDFSKKEGARSIGSEHLLLGILSVPHTAAYNVLIGIGLNFETIKKTIEESRGELEGDRVFSNKISTYLTKIIEDSVRLAMANKQGVIGTEHLLYSICLNKKSAGNIVLENLEIDTEDVKVQIESFFRLKGEMGTDPNQRVPKPFEEIFGSLAGALVGGKGGLQGGVFFGPATPLDGAPPERQGKKGKSKTPVLDYFSEDFTKKASDGKLDPVIGREKEIERVMHILSRKTKNNPVLLGEAGVGKTAIAEGIAQRIANGNASASLLGKRVLSIDLGDLIAGTKYRGEFEERLKEIISEASDASNKTILFIDEIHTIIGLGASEGSLDTANILKPALARGKIQIIGATTIEEYRKNIEKDKALDRRFQKVDVNEPSTEQAVKILEGIKESLESYHNLEIESEALETAVKLSKRYLPDRFLPDKAIDLIDEACARNSSKIEPKDQKEKEKIEKELKEIAKKKEAAVNSQNYEKGLELKVKEEELEEKLEKLLKPKKESKKQVKVTKKEISKTLAEITGISALKIDENEHKKILKLGERLKEEIIGQDEIVEQITKTIIRNRAGVSSPNRPIGSFLFLGPTGVGKTETVKRLAEEMYQGKDSLIKIDMSEFGERHNVSRLIGATAGYVGYEEGGQLTEAVRRKPYAIVLFDEIEKAHPDSFNILLQILEDGQLTDGKGRKINFKNTVVVMTSNIGAETLTREAEGIGFATEEKEKIKDAFNHFEEKKEEVLEEVKDYLLPELLNRIDKILVFNPLDKKTIKQICKLQIEQLKERVAEQKITLEVSDTVVGDISRLAYHPDEGARKVRRIIQELAEEELAEKIMEGKIKNGDTAKLIRKKGSKEEFEIVKKR